MGYALGIDLGTTFTAAAVMRGDRAEVMPLGNHAATVPTMVFLREDDRVLIGDAAERRGVAEPARLAREFKRRLGDTAPIMLDRTPFSADRLLGVMLRQILADVAERQGGDPDVVALTHPANWGEYKVDLLRQAIDAAGVRDAVYLTEPVAAALQYAAGERVEPGEVIAVYDLGGGTFDAAILRKTATGFEVLGRPQGIERLGGIDFDEAVFTHVRKVVGDAVAGLDPSDPNTRAALARLRQECVLAKETLSADSDATVPVLLPNVQTQVRITRAEFEDMIRPILRETVDCLERALKSAGLGAAELKAVLLAGGSSRIPLVADMVRSALNRPVVSDTHPKHAVALGAARFAATAAAGSPAAAPPTVAPVVAPAAAAPVAAPPPPAPAPVAAAPAPPPPPVPPAPVAAAPAAASAVAPTAPMPVTPATAPTRRDNPVVPAPGGPARTGGPQGPAGTQPRKKPAWLWAVAAAAVAAVVVVAVVVLTGGKDDNGTAAGTSTTAQSASDETVNSVSDTNPDNGLGTGTTTTDPEAAALAGLANYVADDFSTASQLVGTFVAQVSAKYVGLVNGDKTFTAADVLADHLQYRDRYGAILVDGGAFDFQFGDARMEGWYLSLVPLPYRTEAEANQWCTDQGLTSEWCFARRFAPPVSGLDNQTCNSDNYCVGIADAHWVNGVLYVSYTVEGFDPQNTGVAGDYHVHFFFSTQDPNTVGVPDNGIWYVWDRADGSGDLVFDGIDDANAGGYGYADGADICITRALHNHELADPFYYYCAPLQALSATVGG